MAHAISEVFPGRPELAATLMEYFDWGTAIAQAVSRDPVGTDLGDPGPTPRWGHEGLLR
jgi:hemoglobin